MNEDTIIEILVDDTTTAIRVVHPFDPSRPAYLLREYAFPVSWLVPKADDQKTVASLVGKRIGDALEIIFAQTNHHDGEYWLKRSGIRTTSTSVGDMVHIRQGNENAFWRCEGTGWRQIDVQMFWRCQRIAPRDASMNLDWLLDHKLVPAFGERPAATQP